MQDEAADSTTMPCILVSCVDQRYYFSAEDAKLATYRDKQISRMLKEQHREDMKCLKLLLLGTGESGKSTITKQMRIIHINGFEASERMEKIADIKRNIKESIVVIISAMQILGIHLEKEENAASMEFILQEAGNPEIKNMDEFMEHASKLWADGGVQNCYDRSNEYQLIDCAKYFLDKIGEIQKSDYIPSDQDILRCRVITTSIQHIEFEAKDSGASVKFSIFDVGGQRGERKKWIQVFDSVVAILFLVDSGSFDQTLREDHTKNRLIEAMEIFEQVWNNRFLRYVSIILFINKIDILAEKVNKGHTISTLIKNYPNTFPSFEDFSPSNNEIQEFIESYPCNEPLSKKRSKSRARVDINPEVMKTAIYIKHLFMKIVKGKIELIKRCQPYSKEWHQHHSCEYYYTCAVDTNNVQHVLHGCRTIIIRKHLERFGIL